MYDLVWKHNEKQYENNQAAGTYETWSYVNMVLLWAKGNPLFFSKVKNTRTSFKYSSVVFQ